MGLNLKEKFEKLNKKSIIIVAVVLFAVAICSICGYEYYQMRSFQSSVMNNEQQLPDLTGNSENSEQVAEESSSKPEEVPTKKPSEYKIGVPYEKAMSGTKPVIALFYADWCGYCIRFMPTYEKLSKIYKNDYEFTKVNVEDEKYISVVRDMGITGFPTVFLLDPKYDNKVLLSNATFGDINLLKKETDRFLRIRKLLDSNK